MVIAGLAAGAGCGSTCASGCPPLLVYVIATPGENLALASARWAGPACPDGQINYCQGDLAKGLTCVQMVMIGAHPGTCQLDLTFNDGRAPFSAVAEFGPETHQGCCHGLPVVGPTVITVPPLHPQPSDAGADGGGGFDASPDGSDADTAPASSDSGALTDSSNGQA
jgi:hypothetical protein